MLLDSTLAPPLFAAQGSTHGTSKEWENMHGAILGLLIDQYIHLAPLIFELITADPIQTTTVDSIHSAQHVYATRRSNASR